MLLYDPAVHQRTKLIVRIFSLLLPLFFLLPPLFQIAEAKTTYVITDGEKTLVHTTSERNPESVLEEAGLVLDAQDTFTTARGTDETEITVRRCQTIYLTYQGETVEVTSYGETLEALLDRLGYTAYGKHVASVALDTQTFDGMNVTVDDMVQSEQTFTQELPFETIYREDDSLPAGDTRVSVKGVPGQARVTANVTYVNAIEKSSTIVSETVLQKPVNEVILVGTSKPGKGASKAPIIGDGVIITADGEILTYSRSQRFITTAYSHLDPGCDMITATGTTVRIGTVAVDPTVVAYGTRMFIVTEDGEYVYGIGTAEDCGVKGRHLDLYFPTREQCIQFGGRKATVYFLD